jgi:hypothetical protein
VLGRIYIDQRIFGRYRVGARAKFDLSKHVMVICDDGSGFFGVLFDMKSNLFSDLAFNGPF